MTDKANSPIPSLSRKESRANKKLANKRTRRANRRSTNRYVFDTAEAESSSYDDHNWLSEHAAR